MNTPVSPFVSFSDPTFGLLRHGRFFCLSRVFALALVCTTLMSTESWGENVLFTNDYDQHDVARTYNVVDHLLDGGPLASNWQNGVVNGRVSLVTGSDALRGSGTSLKVDFPAGKKGAAESGAQWQINLNDSDDYVTGLQMVRLRYRMKFSEGFNFDTGGKLPGLAGGSVPTGFDSVANNGFTARLKWLDDELANADGLSEGNTGVLLQSIKYLESSTTTNGQAENVFFPDSRHGRPGRVEVPLVSGKWYTVTQLVKLNDVGRDNGFIKLWIDGERVLSERGLTFRTDDSLGIDTMYFSTFRGNGDFSSTRAPQDDAIFFDDISIEARGVANLTSVPEPTSLAMAGLAICGLLGIRGRSGR